MEIEGKKYYRLADIAKRFKVSQAFVYNAVRAGDVPAVKLANKLYIEGGAADDWGARLLTPYDPNETKK